MCEEEDFGVEYVAIFFFYGYYVVFLLYGKTFLVNRYEQ